MSGDLIEAGQKDPQIRKWMDEAAVETDKTVIAEFFKWKNDGVPARQRLESFEETMPSLVLITTTVPAPRSRICSIISRTKRNISTRIMMRRGVQLSGDHAYTVTFPKGGVPAGERLLVADTV